MSIQGEPQPDGGSLGIVPSLGKQPLSGASTSSGEAAEAGRWTISTRSIGEVLTTEIRSDRLRMMLFSKPSDETAFEIEQRASELLELDTLLESQASTPGSVPEPLRRAVIALQSLVGTTEHATQRPAGAVVFYFSKREVACACI